MPQYKVDLHLVRAFMRGAPCARSLVFLYLVGRYLPGGK